MLLRVMLDERHDVFVEKAHHTIFDILPGILRGEAVEHASAMIAYLLAFATRRSKKPRLLLNKLDSLFRIRLLSLLPNPFLRMISRI